MRAIRLAGIFVAMLAAGDDSGFPPRAKPSDYPAHESVKTAVISAAILPPDQVRRIFSAGVAKGYTVVEVAVYPQDGHSFDVAIADFSLKVGGQVIRAENPNYVALPWGGSGAPTIGSRGPAVTEDTGVIVEHGTDPTTGRPRTAVGTWEDVGVSNEPRPSDPTPSRQPDQSATRAKIRDQALPEGATSKPVAGYVYFAQYGKKRKNDPVALNYSKDPESIDLKFPK